MTSVPPGAFYFKVEAREFEKWALRDGDRSLSLQCGVWHLLPGSWLEAAKKAVRFSNQDDYLRTRAEIFIPE